ncbi:MAG TPA: hypothetical protein EYQ81_12865 [Sneathiellales bacterium]|nr:hypothetical protein [Sneathiellales bacterium]
MSDAGGPAPQRAKTDQTKDNETTTESTLLALPPELFTKIWAQLSKDDMFAIVQVCTELRGRFPDLIPRTRIHAREVLMGLDEGTEEQRQEQVLPALFEVLQFPLEIPVQFPGLRTPSWDQPLRDRIKDAFTRALAAPTFSRLAVLALSRVNDAWKEFRTIPGNTGVYCLIGRQPTGIMDRRMKIEVYEDVIAFTYYEGNSLFSSAVAVGLAVENREATQAAWAELQFAAAEDRLAPNELFSVGVDRFFEHAGVYIPADDEEPENKAGKFLEQLLRLVAFGPPGVARSRENIVMYSAFTDAAMPYV